MGSGCSVVLQAARRVPSLAMRLVLLGGWALWAGAAAALEPGTAPASDGPGAQRPSHGEADAPQAYANPQLLVDCKALANELGLGRPAASSPGQKPDPKAVPEEGREQQTGPGPQAADLLLIDARAQAAYRAAHLPGAFHLDSDTFQDPESGPFYLPSAESVGKVAARFGLGSKTRVVVYDAEGGRLAARVWFTFWAYGHEQVAILNGGIGRWRLEQLALAQEEPAARRAGAPWEPLPQPRGVCSFAALAGFKAPPAPPGGMPRSSVLDARAFEEYKGVDARAKRGGHVPGAVNIPWDAMVEPVVPAQAEKGDGYFVWKEAAVIHALLRAAGISRNQPLCVYDQSGGRAAHLFFTLQLMGYTQVQNYVGGWREYGNRSDVEVER